MIKFFALGLLIGGLAMAPVWAADSADKKTSHDVNQVKKDYETKIHKDLKKIGAKIDRLKRDVKKTGKDAGTDVNQEIKKLEAKKADVDKKLAALEKSTGDAWKDLRHGVDDAVADLRKSVDDATHQFKGKK